MLGIKAISFAATAFLAASAGADEHARETRLSPDGHYLAAWIDHDMGEPFGVVRTIVVRSSTDPYNIFSLVSYPRYTDAAWNSASNRCVVADAPTNAGPTTWLIYQKTPEEWATRKLDPFGTLEKAFYKADPRIQHLFRPSILKIEWLSASKVRFRGYCNHGTYFITIDTTAPKKSPELKKLSDDWLDE